MNDELELFHTSPNEIEEVNDEGRFGSHLFFSHSPYYMTQSRDPVLYKHKINKKEILNVKRLKNQDRKKLEPYLKNIMQRSGVSEDEALDLLSEHQEIYDIKNKIEDMLSHNQFVSKQDKQRYEKIYKHLEDEDLAEFSWDLQSMAARAAKKLGFRGLQVRDETGTSYMIDMLDRLHELEKHEE